MHDIIETSVKELNTPDDKERIENAFTQERPYFPNTKPYLTWGHLLYLIPTCLCYVFGFLMLIPVYLLNHIAKTILYLFVYSFPIALIIKICMSVFYKKDTDYSTAINNGFLLFSVHLFVKRS